METQQQFEQIMAECRSLFVSKLHDYGAAWRILRPSSLTDQIYIKANRIRSIETKVSVQSSSVSSTMPSSDSFSSRKATPRSPTT